MIRLKIKGLIFNPTSNTPFVLLQTEDEKMILPLSIGPFEASSIIIAMEGIKTPRPLTHDLFIHFFKQHGFKIENIKIYDCLKGKYYAKLHYKKGFKRFAVEIRPSDGLALAVRFSVPIYIKDEIVEMQPYNPTLIENSLPLTSQYKFYNPDSYNDYIM